MYRVEIYLTNEFNPLSYEELEKGTAERDAFDIANNGYKHETEKFVEYYGPLRIEKVRVVKVIEE